jgi:porphobilinogen synthase
MIDSLLNYKLQPLEKYQVVKMKQTINKGFSVSNFPRTRLRRNRMSDFSRKLVAENNLSINDLIYPIFVTYGSNTKEEIESMPGIYRFSLDLLPKEIERISSLEIPAIALFPKIEKSLKNPNGSEALNKNNLICKAIKISKKVNSNLGVICDVALDPFTDHGHDGIIFNNQIDNDKTLEILCNQALIQAEAGCDIIAPSDMMDGRVGFIRDTLDNHGFINVQIMSYAVKYASAFYGPFRDAVGSTLNLSNKSKKSYQMDPANSDEAIREIALDINEGADMFIVKPGMPYLDIIYKIKQEFKIPLYAYQVSGEYSMIKGAIDNGWFDEQKIIFESLIAFKRAGCNGIITYFAPYVANLLKGQNS